MFLNNDRNTEQSSRNSNSSISEAVEMRLSRGSQLVEHAVEGAGEAVPSPPVPNTPAAPSRHQNGPAPTSGRTPRYRHEATTVVQPYCAVPHLSVRSVKLD